MDLMRKNSEEFREFVMFLASDEDSRQAYIRVNKDPLHAVHLLLPLLFT